MSRIATLHRDPRTGVYYYRRAVPDRLRAVIGKREIYRSLRTKNLADAARAHPSAHQETERLFESAGRQIHLTHAQVEALAANWLRAELAAREQDPPDDQEIHLALDEHERADERARKAALPGREDVEAAEGEIAFPTHAAWFGRIGSYLEGVYGAGYIDALAREHGVPHLTEGSRASLTKRLFWRSVELWNVLRRRGEGDYGEPASLVNAPKWETRKAVAKVPLRALYERWVTERGPERKTADDWRARVENFIQFIGHDDAARLSGDDIVKWKDELVSRGLSHSSVNLKYLAALRVTLERGKKNRLLKENVARGIAMLAPRVRQRVEKGYTDEEAKKILTAARGQRGWMRWLPFVVAYTGARVGEVADASAGDIKTDPAGIHYLDLAHRKLKTESSPRLVPLHSALEREGFIKYARSLPQAGPLFPDLKTKSKYGKRAARAVQDISRWVRRDLRITEAHKRPNHAWRHRMATLLRRAKVSDDARRYVIGHKASDDAEGYGQHELPTLAEYVNRIEDQCPSGP